MGCTCFRWLFPAVDILSVYGLREDLVKLAEICGSWRLTQTISPSTTFLPLTFFVFLFVRLFFCFFFFILSVSNELKSRFQIPGLSVKTNYKALPVRVSAVIVYATLYDFWSNHICDTLFQVLILVTSGVVMAVIMFLKAITFIVANISKVRHWFSCYWITMKTGREVGQ